MAQSLVAPQHLQNGIYLQTKEFKANIHLDRAHLMAMEAGKNSDVSDLGMIIPWITTGYMERPPMWEMIKQGTNRVLHMDGHMYTWKQPLADQPTIIVEDISGTDKPGIDGQPFKIKLNKRTFGHSAVITSNKFGGIELVVQPEEIRTDGDHFIYTVVMNATNKKYKYYPKEWLSPNTKLFQIGSVLGEYGQTYNDMGDNIMTGGYTEFYNYVGDGVANTHFTCTRDAAYSNISKSCVIGLQQYRKVVEMYQLHPSSAAYDVSMKGQGTWDTMIQAYEKKGLTRNQATEAIQKDIVKRAWIPEVEQLAMLQVERDVESYAVWGAGGTIQVEGKQRVRLPIGLFHQLNLGPTYTYNIPSFSLRKLEAYLTSRLKDKIDPYGNNVITIGTGNAGLKLVRSQIKDVALNSGLTYDSSKYIDGKDNMNLSFDGPNFSSYRFSFGWVKFVHMPSLDPIEANELENPIVDGFRLSSYIYVIDDMTGQGDNILELLYGPNWDFNHFYINGRMNYMDNGMYGASRSGPYAASNTNPGFEVYIEKRLKAYHIKDITKSLLIKPINPRTGKPIFEPVFG